ncbi:MAG: hypothetical protein KAR20_08865, partial [Candidatus Heimdallarchaeota archaeon]|nr:hypothetical protein [Candidatus Heimdallarchaeota archaeon]
MNIFIKIASTILLLNLVACGSDDIESSRVSNEIIVDGLSNDWSDLKINYNEDLDIAFGVANSDTSLFFMIRFKDERFARMMTMRGFTIWFDDLSEDDPKFGIRYRIPAMHLDRRKPGQEEKP